MTMVAIKYVRGYFKFLPLLALYFGVILIFSSDVLIWDETRHWKYATNLTNGFYTDAENPEIVNGPGYPLVLTPLVLSEAPLIIGKLLNAIFLFFGIVFFYKTISFYLKPTLALGMSYLFGLYPPLIKWIVYIYSEALATFLVCGFLYFFIKALSQSSKMYLNGGLAAFFLGYLALTKVIFGYVIIATALLYVLFYLFKRSKKIRIGILVLAGAFLMCVPFLGYTYSLTGKLMYWGTGGGEILYWRSSPYTNDYGSWISKDVVYGESIDDPICNPAISEDHRAFYRDLESYSHIERDGIFKAKAVENIKNYPIKYLENTATSALRLFFNYPYSYTSQKPTTFFYIIPNGLLLLLLLSAICLAFMRAAAIPFEIRFIGMISIITIVGLVIGNGMARYLIPVIPLLLVFIFFTLNILVKITISRRYQSSGT